MEWEEFCLANVPPSQDISHPGFCPADVPPSPDISYPAPDAEWERRAFQLPRSDISGSSDSTYPESFSPSIQCRGVLLKLPDVSNRHLEILDVKIPKVSFNPPIIGFLSL